MASTRRPTYRAAQRPAPPAGGDEPATISASKSAADLPVEPGASRDPGTPGRNSRSGTRHDPLPDSVRKSVGDSVGKTPPDIARDNVLSFPEPKAKRRRRVVLSVVGVITVLTASIVAAAVFSPWLALRTISVEGNKLLGAEQIQTALAPLQGKPLPQISDADVAALLKPLVAIKDVDTQARPPSTLQVRITERSPVALVKQGGNYQLVDVEGVQLSTTSDPAAVALPVIDSGGEAAGAPIDSELFSAITAVLGALPADVLAKLSDASAASVDAVELKLADGQKIVWGNAGEKELKARVLAALLTVPADPKNPVQVYDVSVPRRPVTR
ncbi:cell division protein FtsQ/DivIB [Arthrobacter oryzae]|uniref:FtsQ-type POTRA domain-containing protein n=1 Tax=Arthrobacter oryzae TaxID=409290 RepID=A0A3N0BSE8_9MICC|nr:FtsQ-type POTRA domain-containing protein [Arthrobacter oryzae]RNL51551.1 FtsQ-type POTRA domain-containing protein [Arthrobacter oryzae]